MKKIFGGLVVLLTCIFLNTTITKAETYNASSLVEKQLYHEGDVIHNDTSSIFHMNKARKGGGAIECIRLNPNEDYTLDLDVYYYYYDTTNKCVDFSTFMVEPKGIKTITVNEGDTVNINLSDGYTVYESGACEIKYRWVERPSDTTDFINPCGDYSGKNITLNNVQCDKNGHIFRVIVEGWSMMYDDTHRPPQMYIKLVVNHNEEHHIYPKSEEESDNKEEVHNEPTKTPEQIESERKNKDTLPSGTIQGIGGKKDFNFKALNPAQRDVNNQQIFADYYAKQLGFKSELLISKDIYAPYGQTKESKWQSRTISWKNTGAKFGDLIYVVWYCQEAHEMQFIQANVLPDGTVVFTIPKSGDVSTISIVKLNK